MLGLGLFHSCYTSRSVIIQYNLMPVYVHVCRLASLVCFTALLSTRSQAEMHK